ncbi:MAG: AI-2E family transporter, partial [Thermoanaerobaculia bacterium]
RGFYPRLFAIAGLAVLGWALFRIFVPFLAPILWSALLAFLAAPLNRRLTGRLKGRKGLAAGLLTAAATLGVAVPAAVLAAVFTRQASDLVNRFSADASRYQLSAPADIFRLPPIARALEWLTGHLPVTAAQIQEWAIEGARRLFELMAGVSGSILVGALGLIVNLLLTLFLLFFFLRDGAQLLGRLNRVIPMKEEQKALLAGQVGAVTHAVVLGTLVTAIVQGTMVGIGFAVVGFPSPVVFGVLAAVLSLLPVGGTALVWGPGAIVLAAQGRWGWAAALAIYGAVAVGAADNFLKPLLISGKADISTLPVFFGFMGGLVAFGPIGMFLGPVLIALGLALLRFAEEAYEAKT